jgi:hypothetical protein
MWEGLLGYGQHRPETIRIADELEKEALSLLLTA